MKLFWSRGCDLTWMGNCTLNVRQRHLTQKKLFIVFWELWKKIIHKGWNMGFNSVTTHLLGSNHSTDSTQTDTDTAFHFKRGLTLSCLSVVLRFFFFTQVFPPFRYFVLLHHCIDLMAVVTSCQGWDLVIVLQVSSLGSMAHVKSQVKTHTSQVKTGKKQAKTWDLIVNCYCAD